MAPCPAESTPSACGMRSNFFSGQSWLCKSPRSLSPLANHPLLLALSPAFIYINPSQKAQLYCFFCYSQFRIALMCMLQNLKTFFIPACQIRSQSKFFQYLWVKESFPCLLLIIGYIPLSNFQILSSLHKLTINFMLRFY